MDLDVAVEELVKKFLRRRNLASCDSPPGTDGVSDPGEVSWKKRSPGTEKCLRPACSPHNGNRVLRELYTGAMDQSGRHNEADGSEGSLADSETGHSAQESDSIEESQSVFYTETDVTLPTSLARTSGVTKTVAHSSGKRGKKKPHGSPHSWSSSPGIGQVYDEMLDIYEKLQVERKHQQHWAMQLQERERQLNQREALLLRHQGTLCKIREIEEEVCRRVSELQEQHEQEVKQLKETLREKVKENKRVKCSFDTIKELNSTMKKQLNNLSEQNKKLEIQWRKEQARVENLQRKYEYSMARKGRENIAPVAQRSKLPKEDKSVMPTKQLKAQELLSHGSSCPTACKLLVQVLDWVSDSYLAPVEECKPRLSPAWDYDRPSSLQERCSKVLPLLTEQMQTMQVLDPSFHVPLLKFIYWSLRQLDGSPQRNTLSSTLRRLGEEVYRGVALQGPSSDPGGPHRTRPPLFFKNPILHTRFLSTLILLETTSQADILAKALDCLHSDVRCEEGRVLFLQYQALSVLLAHLQSSNRGLLSLAVDILMQMSGESWQLDSFLDACSTEDFFRCVSLLLRNCRIEVPLVEKLSILLQKLSKIRKNKRLFEIHGIHLIIQEMHRTLDPAHAFLAINLSSILFNLGMLKKTP